VWKHTSHGRSLTQPFPYVSVHLAFEPNSDLQEGEDLSMNVCKSDDCKDSTGAVNSAYTCYKPLSSSNPDLPGVCLPAELTEGLDSGSFKLAIPILLNIYQAIQTEHTSEQVEIAQSAILEVLNGDTGLKATVDTINGKVDGIDTAVDDIQGTVDDIYERVDDEIGQIKTKVDTIGGDTADIKTKLNGIDATVDRIEGKANALQTAVGSIKSTVADIWAKVSASSRRLGNKDHAIKVPPSNDKNEDKDQTIKVPPSNEKNKDNVSVQETLEQLLKSQKGDLHEKAEEKRVLGDLVSEKL
jgi:archaellum component FlaC